MRRPGTAGDRARRANSTAVQQGVPARTPLALEHANPIGSPLRPVSQSETSQLNRSIETRPAPVTPSTPVYPPESQTQQRKNFKSFSIFTSNVFKWLIYVPRTFQEKKVVPSQVSSCRWFHYYIFVSHIINFPGNKAPMLLVTPPRSHTCSWVLLGVADEQLPN